jgi:hypothetical protein
MLRHVTPFESHPRTTKTSTWIVALISHVYWFSILNTHSSSKRNNITFTILQKISLFCSTSRSSKHHGACPLIMPSLSTPTTLADPPSAFNSLKRTWVSSSRCVIAVSSACRPSPWLLHGGVGGNHRRRLQDACNLAECCLPLRDRPRLISLVEVLQQLPEKVVGAWLGAGGTVRWMCQ